MQYFNFMNNFDCKIVLTLANQKTTSIIITYVSVLWKIIVVRCVTITNNSIYSKQFYSYSIIKFINYY